ncbi:DUF7268 family protein [Halegenticoccus soli]|uniref:DUF7268 family protein n=1 Tax=Halegenticoccus soli TaxID=1985678 RepID=UPI000C6E7245|nr:hypothetical protein [Halegenticoccus soli]
MLPPRARLVASGFAAGVAAGVVGFGAAAVALGSVRAASDAVFALGALALGFGVVGWSGSILAGNGVEAMQASLGVASGWTERKSRRAMARVASFGAGVMAGAVVGTVAAWTIAA